MGSFGRGCPQAALSSVCGSMSRLTGGEVAQRACAVVADIEALPLDLELSELGGIAARVGGSDEG